MPVVTPLSADGEEREVRTFLIRSFFRAEDDSIFHVHPELVGEQGDGTPTIFLCPTCAKAADTPEGRPPPQSIAGGRDYGSLKRIDIEWPGATEELALADVRLYSLVTKVHIPNCRNNAANRRVLRGHVIAFVHDGPAVILKHFDESRIQEVIRNIQIVFVGASGSVTNLEKRALALGDMQLRHHVLYNHLTLRAALHPDDAPPVPTLEDIKRIVTTGLHDSQVQYFEPAKWVAKLRATKTDDHLLLLDTDMETGHGGASGRFKKYERTAKVYAYFLFILDPTLAKWTKP